MLWRRLTNGIVMAGVEQIKVAEGESGHAPRPLVQGSLPGPGFGHLQKLLRSGQVRIDGGRSKIRHARRARPDDPDSPVDVRSSGRRAADGQDHPQPGRRRRPQADAPLRRPEGLRLRHKPAGLAVQGGSGVVRNVDDMLEAWRNQKGEKPGSSTASTATRRACSSSPARASPP